MTKHILRYLELIELAVEGTTECKIRQRLSYVEQIKDVDASIFTEMRMMT